MNLKINPSKSIKKILTRLFRYIYSKINIILPILIGLIILCSTLSINSLTPQNYTNKTIDFSITDIYGKQINFSKLDGFKFLYFYNTNCLECKNDINFFNSVQQTKSIILVSNEQQNIIKEYTKKNSYQKFILISDPQNYLYNLFNIDKENKAPSVYIYNKENNLIYQNFDYPNYDAINNSIYKNSNTIYTYKIDKSKILNACNFANPSIIYKADPQNINVLELSSDFHSDDLIDCINKIQPQFSKNSMLKMNNMDKIYLFSFQGNNYIFPQNILVQHPYLEFEINTMPIGIFYDSLTDNLNIFSRYISGSVLSFYISGREYNNHLLLIDSTNFSLWNGIESVAGINVGQKLERYSFSQINYGDLVNGNNYFMYPPNPSTDYSKNPLFQYYSNGSLFYPENINNISKKESIKLNSVIEIKDIKNNSTISVNNNLIEILNTKEKGILLINKKIGDKIYDFIYENGKILYKLDNEDNYIDECNLDGVCLNGILKDNKLKINAPFIGFKFYLDNY